MADHREQKRSAGVIEGVSKLSRRLPWKGHEINKGTAHIESQRGQVGQGIYSLADLRAYLSLYAGKPGSGELALDWLGSALNPVAHRPRRPDYSFSDLISLFMVRELTKLGVRPVRIREAEDHMRAVTGSDRPFVSNEIVTDGHRVFFAHEVPDQVESASHGSGQQASRPVVELYARRVHYDEGTAVRWCPIDGVVLDPAVQFGGPTVAGTRVPTATVAESAGAVGAERASEWLGLELSQVQAALSFERKLSALQN